jgi:TonB family protein
MITNLLKRALPFALTLIIGTGLGSILGSDRSTTKTNYSHSRAPFVRSVYRSGTGGGEYRHRRGFNDSTPLKIIFQPNTRYTSEALKNKTTGVVQLLVRFDEDGTATVVERLSTLPDGLTEEAVRVVEQTKFNPATVNGQPVPVTKEMNYIFSLSDRATMTMEQ